MCVQLVDEAILFSAVWQAACDVRQYCTFDNWFTGRKPFDILGAYAYPLYGECGQGGRQRLAAKVHTLTCFLG